MEDLNNSTPIFEFYPPANEMIGILSIPHSGEQLPDEFKTYLVPDRKTIMQDVDYQVHKLVDIEKLTAAGIAVIKANIIRTAIDLNRNKETALLNWKMNSKGKQVVTTEPDQLCAKALLEKYYSPYFEMLKNLIFQLRGHTHMPSFIDLHSMPSRAEAYHLKINPKQDIIRPHFCLSDVEGKTCEPDFLHKIGELLKQEYSNVNYNDPYFGGHITRFINDAYDPINNIQIEISREIYMEETDQSLVADRVSKLRPVLTNSLIQHFEYFYQKYKC